MTNTTIACKNAIRNSKGQYAGAGNRVTLILNSGEQISGVIESIPYASMVKLGSVKYGLSNILDFRLE